jgi:hypothetical protein
LISAALRNVYKVVSTAGNLEMVGTGFVELALLLHKFWDDEC